MQESGFDKCVSKGNAAICEKSQFKGDHNNDNTLHMVFSLHDDFPFEQFNVKEQLTLKVPIRARQPGWYSWLDTCRSTDAHKGGGGHEARREILPWRIQIS